MPNQITVPVNAGSLPSGTCPDTYQGLLNAFALALSVTIPLGSGVQVVASPTKPVDTTVLWLQLDSLGRPVRLYYFAQGAWLWQHPWIPGSGMTWYTALPDFTTFDGGDANPLSNISGPMWEEVTAMRYRVPVGVGTFPDSGTVLAVGDQHGEERHQLVLAELPKITIPNFVGLEAVVSAAGGTRFDEGPGSPKNRSRYDDASAWNDQPHNNLQPYTAVYFLRRTARTHYSIT